MDCKGSFQNKLKNIVIRKLIILIATGILLFATGIFLALTFTNLKNARDNGREYRRTVESIYNACADFLQDENLQETCKNILLYQEDTSRLPYFIYAFNADFPMDAKIVLSDKERVIVYTTYEDSQWNLYRNSFNKAVCDNAFRIPKGEIYTSVYFFDDSHSNFVLSKPIYNQGLTIGYINLYLNDNWEEILLHTEYDGVLTDEKGRVIYSSRQSLITGINKFNITIPRRILSVNGRRYWCNRSFVEEANVYIYSLVYYPGNSYLWLTAVSILLFMGFFWYKLANNMTETMAKSNAASIGKLVSEIQVISGGNTEYRVSVDTEDEFSQVGVHINQMLDNIYELNQRNTELLQTNNITEINHLTAQINPHFLYNTLEIIRNLIVFDKKKADALIVKLTQILRYSINTSTKYVPLGEDMSYIQDYLTIQKTRFEDNLQYEIAIDEACNSCIVPKLLLQPLLENSIKYGFQKKMGIKIWIEGYIDGQMLYLSVTDDGDGIGAEEIELLCSNLHEAISESEHHGLHNIARRLYLLYGPESGLKIRNTENRGLQVQVCINLSTGIIL